MGVFVLGFVLFVLAVPTAMILDWLGLLED
jgi:hypothetical protein